MSRSEVSQESPSPDPVGVDGSERAASRTFLVAELGALIFYVTISRPMWFYLDEWDFLANRTAGNLGDLFRAHNEHWVTVPVLVYRVLWWTFGLRSYRPYQLVIILLHLSVALLARRVMRRAGVRPWTATIVACVFVLFGSGYQNIVYPFQMTLVGSLVFGLVQLLLATDERHANGSIDRRDYYGLAAGCVGMMCSGVAVPMVVTVGVAVLLLRGWRAALFHTIPLAALYVAWFEAIGHTGYTGYHAGPGQIASFVRTFIAATFGAVGHYRGVGIALGVLLVGGLIVAWRPLGRSALRGQAALPIALLIGGLTLLTITAFGRAGLSNFTEKSRYLHLVAAMILPALAVAADAVIRRWRWLTAFVVALLVVGVPSNTNLIINYMHRTVVTKQVAYKQLMLSVPRVPDATQVPPDVKPEQTLAHFVTIGWLRSGVASGRIPKPRKISPVDVAIDDLRLSFLQTSDPLDPHDICVGLKTPMVFNLTKGERIVVRAKNNSLRMFPASGAVGRTFPFLLETAPPVGNNLIAVQPVSFVVNNTGLAIAPQVCGTAEIMNAAIAAGAAHP